MFMLGLLISWLIFKAAGGRGNDHRTRIMFLEHRLTRCPNHSPCPGGRGTFSLFLLISVHGIIIFTAVTTAIEIAKGRDAGLIKLPKQILGGLLGNPLIIGLGLGFLWRLTGLGIHPIAADLFHLVTTSITPAALFVLGSSLMSYSISGSIGPALLVTILKNMLHPLVVFLLGSWLGLEILWLSVANNAGCDANRD